MAGEFTFEITKHHGVLEAQAKGWKVELNEVSWNRRASKYDIRPWNEDHSQCGKGITLSDVAMEALIALLQKGGK